MPQEDEPSQVRIEGDELEALALDSTDAKRKESVSSWPARSPLPLDEAVLATLALSSVAMSTAGSQSSASSYDSLAEHDPMPYIFAPRQRFARHRSTTHEPPILLADGSIDTSAIDKRPAPRRGSDGEVMLRAQSAQSDKAKLAAQWPVLRRHRSYNHGLGPELDG